MGGREGGREGRGGGGSVHGLRCIGRERGVAVRATATTTEDVWFCFNNERLRRESNNITTINNRKKRAGLERKQTPKGAKEDTCARAE